MTANYKIDPELSRTAARYRPHAVGLDPQCWDIVQVDAAGAETTIGTFTLDELGPKLQAIQGNGETPEPGETGDLPIWEQVVERAWLQRIKAAAEKCNDADNAAIPLLRPAEDDRCAAKRRLADLIEATDGYVTWCRN